jgi:serine/threonine protein kinase/tetratricopeptide (TPR) repeat protein
MAPAGADRNLLFGILALQMDFITRDDLIAAMNAWVLTKDRALEDLLQERGALAAGDRAVLQPLVRRHIEQHIGDPTRSLASLSSVDWLRRYLAPEAQADPDVQATLDRLPSHRRDPGATTDSIGSPGPRFRILRPHAKGGLGEVFIARDAELHREVALKQIQDRHADHPESRSRFVLEAEVTGGLEHPGIVPVYSLGHDPEGRPYYAMRFVRGDSLKQAIDSFHRGAAADRPPGERMLELQKLLRRFLDVCNAIAYAHSRGVLHRDLKPGNILVGPFGETLVVDWGLAKVVGTPEDCGEATLRPPSASGSSETLPGAAIGTPSFMSPEQAAGRLDELGPASDVYSLGATLYCLLTGRAPIEGTGIDLEEVLRRVRAGAIPPPRQVEPGVPRALEAICLKAMAPRPADRYASPRGLAGDLERWLADEPVRAYAEPLPARARRWMRRHRTLVTSAAAVLVFGLAGLAGFATVLAGKNRELDAKNVQLAGRNAELDQQRRLAEDQRNRAIAAERVAREQEAKSQRAEAEAKAVLEFFQTKVLAAARPKDEEGGLGIEATIRAAVDAAEPAIDKTFADQPTVAASIRHTLGTTYWYLGEPAPAIRQFEQALALRRRAQGPDHPETLDSMNSLANAYQDAGRIGAALTLYEETLKQARAKLGPDDPNTLSSMNNLAVAYNVTGRLDKALILYEETLKQTRAKLGPDHPDTLNSMSNLADAYRDAGRLAEALTLHEESWKRHQARLGPDHPDTLRSMSNLARTYRATGRLPEAIALHEETLKWSRSKLGPDHPATLSSMNNLAGVYEAAGRGPALV